MAAAKSRPRSSGKPPARPAKAEKAGKAAKTSKAAAAPRPAKKAARGASGTKVARAAKPKAPGQAKPAAPAAPAARKAPRTPSGPLPEDEGQEAWIVLPSAHPVSTLPPPAPAVETWMPAERTAGPGFDPSTGAWLPVGPPRPAADVAPDAPKKGVGYVLWTVLLWIDLAALAFATLGAILTGATLLFAPDSESADRIRQELEGSTVTDVVLNTVLGLLAFGVIPFLWVLGTRREPKEGTKRFLHLHLHRHAKGGKALATTVLWGALLALGMLLAVFALITVYTLATEGADAFSGEEEPNPAVQGILEHLSWPLAILIAVGAGVGEEVFFRGLLQRYVGVWGQAALFGVAHATGGYIPQILFAFGMGVAFGFLLKRGWSLWTLVVAHVLYDFVLLALALLYPELG